LFPYVAALGLLGAVSLMLWLLAFGVNEQRWKEQAGAALSTIIYSLRGTHKSD
jgi:hypothetical protein